MTARALPPFAAAFVAAALAGAAGLALLLATQRLGLLAIAALVAGVGALALVARPVAAVAALVGIPVLLEQRAGWGGNATGVLYERFAGFQVYPLEMLAALAVLAVLVDARHRKAFHGLGPFTFPAFLLVLALVGGAVTGAAAGADSVALQEGVRTPLLVLVTALVVAHVLSLPGVLPRAIGAVGVAAVVKGVLGVLLVAAGLTPIVVEEAPATYLEATPNFVVVVFLLGLVAFRLARVPIPRWALLLTPIAVACLVLSYRRSWWIAMVVSLAVLLVVATSGTTRRILMPLAAAAVLGVVAFVSAGGSVTVSGPVGERIERLGPSNLASNAYDRYRIGERVNLVQELRASPIAGLGIGVAWRARDPLALEHPAGRRYSHIGPLFFWMKWGLLGVLAYLSFIVTSVVVGLRVWWRHPDRMIAAAGLAAGMGGLALGVSELTHTFVASEQRMSIAAGALFGALAALHLDLRRATGLARRGG